MRFSLAVFGASLLLPLSLYGQQPDPCQAVSVNDSITNQAVDDAFAATVDLAAMPAARAARVIELFYQGLAPTNDLYEALAGCFLSDIPEGSLARSASSATSNPSSGALIERSGFTDLFSIALDGLNFVGSDKNAVTINLNALALFGLGRDSVYSSPAEFQRAGPLRRFAGSITFGAEVPKKAITGFSGFPDAEELFDAVTWDVRVRVIGDRDPRAKQWESVLRSVSVGTNVATTAATRAQRALRQDPSVDEATFEAVRDSLMEMGNRNLRTATRRIQNSWQVTVKASGQHIVEMEDADKYSFTVEADRGLGRGWDVTLNGSYSRSSEGMGASDSPMPGSPSVALRRLLAGQDSTRIKRLENLQLNAGLTGTILRDLIVPGRGAELTVSGRIEVPLGEDIRMVLPGGGDSMMMEIDRSPVYKANITLTVPFGDAGKIPISVTYTNDSDALTDQDFVEGRIGVSWDFAAVTAALKSLAGGD